MHGRGLLTAIMVQGSLEGCAEKSTKSSQAYKMHVHQVHSQCKSQAQLNRGLGGSWGSWGIPLQKWVSCHARLDMISDRFWDCVAQGPKSSAGPLFGNSLLTKIILQFICLSLRFNRKL